MHIKELTVLFVNYTSIELQPKNKNKEAAHPTRCPAFALSHPFRFRGHDGNVSVQDTDQLPNISQGGRS